VALLDDYLDPPGGGLPPSSVVVVQLSERSLGLGGLRGLDRVGPFSAVELHGGRVDAVVRFQVFGADAGAANTVMLALQGRLLAARADLWDAGLLEMSGSGGTVATAEQNAFARTADYTVLFEYHLAPTSGAESLIAQIPIRADQEVANSAVAEFTIVTDAIVRWDDVEAPALVLRGRGQVSQFATLSFVPGAAPSGAVNMLRTHDAATGPPATFASFDAFLAAVSDPDTPETHAAFTFASLTDFLAAFDATGAPLVLGDWNIDGTPDEYAVGVLPIDPVIDLTTARDRLEISLETSPLDEIGVVYLRAAPAVG
jgi:hypothetical protein